MERVGITAVEYVDIRNFNEGAFVHRDARVMDSFSKLAVEVAGRLFHKVCAQDLSRERMGVVLATRTGVYGAIRDFLLSMEQRGYIGINPSKYPNIMMSTPLCRVTSTVMAAGPSVAMYINEKYSTAVKYALAQIAKGRSDGMLVLFINENHGGFGLFIEKENTALKRGAGIRFPLGL